MSHLYNPCLHCPIPSYTSAEASCSVCVMVFLERAVGCGHVAVNWAAVQKGLQRIGKRGLHVRARG